MRWLLESLFNSTFNPAELTDTGDMEKSQEFLLNFDSWICSYQTIVSTLCQLPQYLCPSYTYACTCTYMYNTHTYTVHIHMTNMYMYIVGSKGCIDAHTCTYTCTCLLHKLTTDYTSLTQWSGVSGLAPLSSNSLTIST